MIEAETSVLGVAEHRYIIVIPDNPTAFQHNGLFQTVNGQLESTISGEPAGDLFHPLLVSLPNADLNSPANNYVILQPPNGESDTAFINSLLNVAGSYQNNLNYSPVPGEGTYNSNSFNSGVLISSGETVPNLDGWAPGADSPVPNLGGSAHNFGGKENAEG